MNEQQEIFRLKGELANEIKAHKETARCHIESELGRQSAIEAIEALIAAQDDETEFDDYVKRFGFSPERAVENGRECLARQKKAS